MRAHEWRIRSGLDEAQARLTAGGEGAGPVAAALGAVLDSRMFTSTEPLYTAELLRSREDAAGTGRPVNVRASSSGLLWIGDERPRRFDELEAVVVLGGALHLSAEGAADARPRSARELAADEGADDPAFGVELRWRDTTVHTLRGRASAGATPGQHTAEDAKAANELQAMASMLSVRFAHARAGLLLALRRGCSLAQCEDDASARGMLTLLLGRLWQQLRAVAEMAFDSGMLGSTPPSPWANPAGSTSAEGAGAGGDGDAEQLVAATLSVTASENASDRLHVLGLGSQTAWADALAQGPQHGAILLVSVHALLEALLWAQQHGRDMRWVLRTLVPLEADAAGGGAAGGSDSGAGGESAAMVPALSLGAGAFHLCTALLQLAGCLPEDSGPLEPPAVHTLRVARGGGPESGGEPGAAWDLVAAAGRPPSAMQADIERRTKRRAANPLDALALLAEGSDIAPEAGSEYSRHSGGSNALHGGLGKRSGLAGLFAVALQLLVALAEDRVAAADNLGTEGADTGLNTAPKGIALGHAVEEAIAQLCSAMAPPARVGASPAGDGRGDPLASPPVKSIADVIDRVDAAVAAVRRRSATSRHMSGSASPGTAGRAHLQAHAPPPLDSVVSPPGAAPLQSAFSSSSEDATLSSAGGATIQSVNSLPSVPSVPSLAHPPSGLPGIPSSPGFEREVGTLTRTDAIADGADAWAEAADAGEDDGGARDPRDLELDVGDPPPGATTTAAHAGGESCIWTSDRLSAEQQGAGTHVDGADTTMREASTPASGVQPDGLEAQQPAVGADADAVALERRKSAPPTAAPPTAPAPAAGMPSQAMSNPSPDGGKAPTASDRSPHVTGKPLVARAATTGPPAGMRSDARQHMAALAPPFNHTLRHSVRLENQLREKANVFNTAGSGKKGVRLLVEKGLVGDSPADIGGFIKMAGPRLRQRDVADYLGSEQSRAVLEWYLDSMELSGMRIDAALRKLNTNVQLRVEGQKMERILETFARRFHECNPGVFEDADKAFISIYSLIMVNTSAHNDKVKQKISKEGFVDMNREQKLPVPLLHALYDNVSGCDLQIEERSQLEVVKEGWLLKQNRRRMGWKWRYVVLSTRAIYVYKRDADEIPAAFCPLEFSVIAQQTAVGPMSKKFEVRVLPDGPGGSGGTPRMSARKSSVASTGPEPGRHLVFEADNERLASEWIKAIQQFTLQEGVLVVPEDDFESWEQQQQQLSAQHASLDLSAAGSPSNSPEHANSGPMSLRERRARQKQHQQHQHQHQQRQTYGAGGRRPSWGMGASAGAIAGPGTGNAQAAGGDTKAKIERYYATLEQAGGRAGHSDQAGMLAVPAADVGHGSNTSFDGEVAAAMAAARGQVAGEAVQATMCDSSVHTQGDGLAPGGELRPARSSALMGEGSTAEEEPEDGAAHDAEAQPEPGDVAHAGRPLGAANLNGDAAAANAVHGRHPNATHALAARRPASEGAEGAEGHERSGGVSAPVPPTGKSLVRVRHEVQGDEAGAPVVPPPVSQQTSASDDDVRLDPPAQPHNEEGSSSSTAPSPRHVHLRPDILATRRELGGEVAIKPQILEMADSRESSALPSPFRHADGTAPVRGQSALAARADDLARAREDAVRRRHLELRILDDEVPEAAAGVSARERAQASLRSLDEDARSTEAVATSLRLAEEVEAKRQQVAELNRVLTELDSAVIELRTEQRVLTARLQADRRDLSALHYLRLQGAQATTPEGRPRASPTSLGGDTDLAQSAVAASAAAAAAAASVSAQRTRDSGSAAALRSPPSAGLMHTLQPCAGVEGGDAGLADQAHRSRGESLNATSRGTGSSASIRSRSAASLVAGGASASLRASQVPHAPPDAVSPARFSRDRHRSATQAVGVGAGAGMATASVDGTVLLKAGAAAGLPARLARLVCTGAQLSMLRKASAHGVAQVATFFWISPALDVLHWAVDEEGGERSAVSTASIRSVHRGGWHGSAPGAGGSSGDPYSAKNCAWQFHTDDLVVTLRAQDNAQREDWVTALTLISKAAVRGILPAAVRSANGSSLAQRL